MNIEILTEEEKNEIISYGLQRAKSMCISIAATLLLGLVFHIFLQSVIFLMCFICLRRYAGGYHAKTQEKCYILSLGIIIAVFLTIKYVHFHTLIFVLMQTVNFLALLALVPVDSENRRLEQWEKEKYGTKAKIISTVTYTLCLAFLMSDMMQIAVAIGLANLVAGGCVVAGFAKNKVGKVQN